MGACRQASDRVVAGRVGHGHAARVTHRRSGDRITRLVVGDGPRDVPRSRHRHAQRRRLAAVHDGGTHDGRIAAGGEGHLRLASRYIGQRVRARTVRRGRAAAGRNAGALDRRRCRGVGDGPRDRTGLDGRGRADPDPRGDRWHAGGALDDEHVVARGRHPARRRGCRRHRRSGAGELQGDVPLIHVDRVSRCRWPQQRHRGEIGRLRAREDDRGAVRRGPRCVRDRRPRSLEQVRRRIDLRA